MGDWEQKLQIEVQRQKAEIERLTAEVERANVTIVEMGKVIKHQRAEVERLQEQRNHLMNVCPIGTLLTMDGETIYKGDNEWVTLTP